MTTMEYLKANGVRLLRADKTEANSLGYWETAENLNNVVGKSVWICDFRNNEKNVCRIPRCSHRGSMSRAYSHTM